MSEPSKPVVSRSFSWRWRALLAGAAFGAILGFAPTLVSKTPLLGWLVAAASREVRGSVHVGGAQLSWFHPPVLLDVELRDPQGRVIIAAPRMELSRSLVAVALDSRHLGTLTFNEPRVNLTATGDDTNLEQALAAFIEGEPTSRYRTGLDVVIDRGILHLVDEDVKERWQVRGVTGRVQVPRQRDAAIEISLCGEAEIDGAARRLEVRVGYRSGEGGPGLPPQILVDVTTESVPAAAVATFLRRVEPGLRFRGVLSGQLLVVWDDERPEQPKLTLRGEVTGRQVGVRWPAISTESLILGDAVCPIDLSWSGGKIVSKATHLKCRMGEVSFTGEIDLRRDPLSMMQQSGVQFSCDVDLAMLSGWLSQPLQLRDDLRVTGGRLTAAVRSEPAADGSAWSGRLTASDLRADRLGQSIEWRQPIAIEFDARQAAHGLPRVDRFLARTDFGTLQAAGTEEELTAEGRLELNLLFDRLRQFVNLAEALPGGSLSFRLGLNRDRSGTFQLRGEGRLRDASYATLGATWREPELHLRVEGQGRIKTERDRLDTGSLVLAAGGDTLSLQLMEPIPDLWSPQASTVQVSLRGDLGRWLSRFASLVGGLREVKAGGIVDAGGKVRVGSGLVHADALEASVQNLRLAVGDWNIVEPNVRVRMQRLKWNRSEMGTLLEIFDVALTSPAMQAIFPTIRSEATGSSSWKHSARGEIRGDLARLQRWLPALADEPLAGSFDGIVQIATDEQSSRLQGDVTARQVVWGSPGSPLWTEPIIRLALRAAMPHGGDVVVLEDCKATSHGLGLSAAGRVAAWSTVPEMQLTGTVSYDWERLEPQLRRLLGVDVRVTGRDQRPFRLEGPLTRRPTERGAAASATTIPPWAGWKGDWSIGWQSLQLLGCTIGPADFQARMLGDGWIRVSPVETTLNRGRLRLEPFVKLDEPKPLLILGKNTRLDRAQITAGLSDESLGYAAPALAGLRDPLGEFSVELEGAKIPLTEVKQADVWGKVTIHSIRATPGPLLTEITRALKLPVGLNLTKEQTIPVRLTQGRVHHQNLEIPLGEVDLKTSGSVGLDGSLSILAEFPTPQRWLGKNAPRALGVIRLPIGGTLTAPRIDPQALQQIVSRYAVEATGELLRRELEKNLPKWFQGPPKK